MTNPMQAMPMSIEPNPFLIMWLLPFEIGVSMWTCWASAGAVAMGVERRSGVPSGEDHQLAVPPPFLERVERVLHA